MDDDYTSTHFLRAKSRPHPWTKSFCRKQYVRIQASNEVKRTVGDTTPPESYAIHSAMHPLRIQLPLFQQTCISDYMWKTEISIRNNLISDCTPTLHMVAGEGRYTSQVSPQLLCEKAKYHSRNQYSCVWLLNNGKAILIQELTCGLPDHLFV
jgi:hypothetical protein